MGSFVYCLNTSTIRPTPLLTKIKLAGEVGFEAIEPWNDEVDQYLAAGGSMAELKSALSDAGLKVVSMIALHSWVTTEGDERIKALDECRRRMDQAVELGSPSIVASPPPRIIPLDLAALRYHQLLELGREAGIHASMEFLGFVDGIKNVASAMAIALGSGSPEATIVADVFHMIRGGGTVDDLLQLPGSMLSCFHINDVPADPPPLTQTDADRVQVGEGIADLPRVIANLRTIGYSGPLSLELFNPTLWAADPREVLKVGLDRIKQLTA